MGGPQVRPAGDTDLVTSRYDDLVTALRQAVFESAGEVEPAVRQAAGTGVDVPAPWTAYVAKVRDASYRITDADLAALKGAGCTEEQIFEVTVAAAQGAALHRLDVGLRAMSPEA